MNLPLAILSLGTLLLFLGFLKLWFERNEYRARADVFGALLVNFSKDLVQLDDALRNVYRTGNAFFRLAIDNLDEIDASTLSRIRKFRSALNKAGIRYVKTLD